MVAVGINKPESTIEVTTSIVKLLQPSGRLRQASSSRELCKGQMTDRFPSLYIGRALVIKELTGLMSSKWRRRVIDYVPSSPDQKDSGQHPKNRPPRGNNRRLTKNRPRKGQRPVVLVTGMQLQSRRVLPTQTLTALTVRLLSSSTAAFSQRQLAHPPDINNTEPFPFRFTIIRKSFSINYYTP